MQNTVQTKAVLTLPSIADIYAPIYNYNQPLTTNPHTTK
jgi:hypothetical protein